jgi:hypothetical protein
MHYGRLYPTSFAILADQGFKRYLATDVHHFYFRGRVVADLWPVDWGLASDYRQCRDRLVSRDRSLLKIEIYIEKLSHTLLLFL